ncbi:MAG: glycosyltransferase family 39 protein [Nitrospirae bacterium]|nr:glycosyltransferase family 39 protein [Nitrospirota bacterium]
MKIRKEHTVLLIILFLSTVIRVILFRNEAFIGIDGASMARLGKNLVESGKYSFGENYNWGIFFPPGYPAFIGLANLLFDDLYFSGKIVSLFSSLVTIFLCYLIGKELYDEESGLFAAFAFSIHPFMLETSSAVGTEAIFLLFLATSMYLFMLSLRRRGGIIFFLSGVSTGLAYLIRPEGLLLLLLPVIAAFRSDLYGKGRYLSRLGITFVVFILVASPNVLFLKRETGKLQLSGKNSYLAGMLEAGLAGLKEGGPEAKKDDLRYDRSVYSIDDDGISLKGLNKKQDASVIGFIVKRTFSFFQSYIRNAGEAAYILLKLLLPVIFPLFLTFSIKGIITSKKNLTLLFFSLLLFSVYPSFFIQIRYLFPTAILLIILSSSGFARSPSACSRVFDLFGIKWSLLIRHLKPLLVIFCIAASAYTSFSTNIFDEKIIPVEHIKAAEYLKEKYSPEYEEFNVMHRVPWVSFYSGSRFTMLPYAGYSDMISYAKRYHVDFIVIDGRTTVRLWENFDELLNMEKYSDEVELVYEDNSVEMIRVFRVIY